MQFVLWDLLLTSQNWTNQRNWQHMIHKTKKNKTKNTTQYVLDTTIRKQTQTRHEPSYQLLERKMNHTSLPLRNHNGHHNTKLRT